MKMAFAIAERSTCLRLNVGAIFAIDGRPLVGGYNGAPSGMPHCTKYDCNPSTPCTKSHHAEANGIAFAARHGVALNGSSLYVTNSPCKPCAMLLINAGVANVYYAIEYRDPSGVDLLKFAGIPTHHYNPEAI